MVLWLIKVGRSASQKVIIELVRMKCLPILLYETAHLLRKDISPMEYIQNCTFDKIEINNECRKAFNVYHLNQVIKNRQLKFIAKLPVLNKSI